MSTRMIDLASLYVAEQGRLTRLVRRLVGNKTVAEDLVQDAFINLLRAISCSEIDHSQSYLTRTARNLAIDHLRRERHRSRFAGDLAPSQDPVCDQPLPDAIVLGRQELAALHAAVEHMPIERRVVFLLSREYGLPMREIAEKLKISPKVVEKHIMRAMIDCRLAMRTIGRHS